MHDVRHTDVHLYFEIAGHESRFRLVKFLGYEGLSKLYRFDIFLGSEDRDIGLDPILGMPARLVISTGEEIRTITGVVSRFLWIGESGGLSAYYAEMVPWTFLLTHRFGSRIFQDSTVLDIIPDVMRHGSVPPEHYDLSHVQNKEKKYQTREYCVQYRESNFNFISRLMEEEGLFYYFRHPYDEETRRWRDCLTVEFRSSACHDIHGKAALVFDEPKGELGEESFVYEFRYGHQVRLGAVRLRDYNYQNPAWLPDQWLQVSAYANRETNLEFYDYPGKYETQETGQELAHIRLEEMRAEARKGYGHSNCCRLAPGFCFTLDRHPRGDLNQRYLLLSVAHAGSQRETTPEESGLWNLVDKGIEQMLSYLPSLGPVSPATIYGGLKKLLIDPLFSRKEFVYTNEFECQPADVPYRPPRFTPRPVISGLQTAVVKQPHTDEMGRVKVRFPWDPDVTRDDDKRTCYLRVAYPYAGMDRESGKIHGFQFHPQVGDEVVVSFLEGDPDKPLILGSVYNGLNDPPLLPENRVENTILSPYQHQLLLSDREKTVTLKTGGGQVVKMVDGEKDNLGSQVKISTADDHSITMVKGNSPEANSFISAIRIGTEKNNRVILFDQPFSRITLENEQMNLFIRLEFDEQKILIKNETGKEIAVECPRGQVNVVGGSVAVSGGEVRINGSSQVKIDSAGQVSITAPTIKLEASSFELTAAAVKVEAATIDLNAATINLNAPLVTSSGVVKCDTLITNSVVSAAYTPGAGNVW